MKEILLKQIQGLEKLATPPKGQIPIEHIEEYSAAVSYYARRGQLPECMGSPGAIDYILGDLEAFESDVMAELYSIIAHEPQDLRERLRAGLLHHLLNKN